MTFFLKSCVLLFFLMFGLVNGQGWVGYVQLLSTNYITSMNAVMIVPRYPNAVGSYYLFPAMQNNEGPTVGIVQPVLTGGYAAGGYTVNAGLCCAWSTPWTTPFSVVPGDQITMTNNWVASTNTWNIAVAVPGHPTQSVSFVSPTTEMNWGVVAVELYNLVSWDFGPMIYPSVVFQTTSPNTQICQQATFAWGIMAYHIGSQTGTMTSIGASCTYSNLVIWNANAATLDYLINLPTAAYSLRNLTQSYKGKAIQIRRSNDSVTTDIGFDATGNLDTATLLNFVGPNDGHVVTWYDQSGHGNNAVQSTAAQQPLIVSKGALVTSGGQPSVLFTASSNHYFQLNSYPFQNSASAAAYVVNNVRTSQGWQRYFDFGSGTSVNFFATPTSTNTFRITTSGSGGEQGDAGQLIGSTNQINLAEFHHSGVGSTITSATTIGSKSLTSGSQSITIAPSALNGVGNNYIGRSQYSADPYFDGWISEIIFFGSDPAQTSTPPQIQSFTQSIRNHYKF